MSQSSEKGVSLKKDIRRRILWTEEEEILLASIYEQLRIEDLCRFFNVTYRSITYKLKKMGLRKKTYGRFISESMPYIDRRGIKNIHYVDGRSMLPEYSVWSSMIQRCTNPNDKAYKNYGGRGISVYKKWREDFGNFYKDMGLRPSQKHTIERINNDGDYEPSNCEWATREKQSINKRSNRLVTMGGETKTLQQWINESGIKYATVNKRLYIYKWDIERALTTPTQKRSYQNV
jgi:hypothetical protein